MKFDIRVTSDDTEGAVSILRMLANSLEEHGLILSGSSYAIKASSYKYKEEELR